MYLMLSDQFKPQVVRIITPIARFFLKIGISPDAMTFIGTILVVFGSFRYVASGEFISGVIFISLMALSDLFDGTMARISNRGSSKWGSFLDSTLDRVSDNAILISLAIYLANKNDRLTVPVLLLIPISFLIPYIRAKAESLQIECTGGIAERTERLIIILLAILLEGFAVPYALGIGIWVLLALAIITVIQRMAIVWHATR